MSKAMLENDELRRQPADLNANFTPWTMLPIVGNDEPLVRSYLKQFLVKADSPREYEPFINDIYLKHLFAETKIENGLGEPETWAAQLPPELFRQLKDRIDIDFAFTNKTDSAVDEPVKLELFIKNVPTLDGEGLRGQHAEFLPHAKARSGHGDQPRRPGGQLGADATPTPKRPFRRVGRTFEFPQLTKPGVYVVDFIGGGKSSRALIRKGRLRTLAGMSTAGQKLTIIDESQQVRARRDRLARRPGI